jgi:hypothetical protein
LVPEVKVCLNALGGLWKRLCLENMDHHLLAILHPLDVEISYLHILI